jgi:hypothetical protein
MNNLLSIKSIKKIADCKEQLAQIRPPSSYPEVFRIQEIDHTISVRVIESLPIVEIPGDRRNEKTRHCLAGKMAIGTSPSQQRFKG